jgi:hypothetical protein
MEGLVSPGIKLEGSVHLRLQLSFLGHLKQDRRPSKQLNSASYRPTHLQKRSFSTKTAHAYSLGDLLLMRSRRRNNPHSASRGGLPPRKVIGTSWVSHQARSRKRLWSSTRTGSSRRSQCRSSRCCNPFFWGRKRLYRSGLKGRITRIVHHSTNNCHREWTHPQVRLMTAIQNKRIHNKTF